MGNRDSGELICETKTASEQKKRLLNRDSLQEMCMEHIMCLKDRSKLQGHCLNSN